MAGMGILLALIVFVAFLEIPRLAARRWWRELIVFSLFLATSFVLSLLITLGVQLLYLSPAITNLIKSIVGR